MITPTMKPSLTLLFALLLAPLTALSASEPPAQSRSAAKTAGGNPNVIFILTDDQGWGDARFAGLAEEATSLVKRLHGMLHLEFGPMAKAPARKAR